MLFHCSHSPFHLCHAGGEQDWLGRQRWLLRLLISMGSCCREVKGAVVVWEQWEPRE